MLQPGPVPLQYDLSLTNYINNDIPNPEVRGRTRIPEGHYLIQYSQRFFVFYSEARVPPPTLIIQPVMEGNGDWHELGVHLNVVF